MARSAWEAPSLREMGSPPREGVLLRGGDGALRLCCSSSAWASASASSAASSCSHPQLCCPLAQRTSTCGIMCSQSCCCFLGWHGRYPEMGS